jgi:VRR-NUC domain-containing protein
MVAYLNKKEFKKLFPELPKELRKPTIKCPLESSEAKTFWEWAQYHPIAKNYLFAIPNGGSRNAIEAKNLQAQGVKKGVSDYFLAHPANGKHGMFIELKRANKAISRLTLEQAMWLGQCERIGYATKVAYGADEAIRAVEEYLK